MAHSGALPKSSSPEGKPSKPRLEAANDNEEVEVLRAANDNEREFEMSTSLEMSTFDKKMLEDFKDRYLVGKENIPDLKILVVNTGAKVPMEEAFSNNKHITYISETRGDANRLARHGLHSIKADYQVRQEFPDQETGNKTKGGFNVVIILDPHAEPTPKFERTIEGHGWILCKAKMAGALRGSGHYEIIDAIGKDGMAPTFEHGSRDKDWGEAATDAELKAESSPEKTTKGVLTYEKAVLALKASGMEEKQVDRIVEQERVLSEYRRLREEKPDQKWDPVPLKSGDDSLTYIVRKSAAFDH